MKQDTLLSVLRQKVVTTFYRRMVVVTKQVGPDVAIRKADIDAVIETLDASHLPAYLEFKPWVDRGETEQRLAQGHLCMAAWYEGKIVHAAWAAEKRAHIPYVHSDILLEPNAFCIYDSYTRPESRRSKLVLARSTMHAHFAHRGFTRGYGAIALMNKAGLSIVRARRIPPDRHVYLRETGAASPHLGLAEGRGDPAKSGVSPVRMLLLDRHPVYRALRPVCLLFLLLACAPSSLVAQTAGVVAARVPDETLRLDGRLSDEQWEAATPVGGFVQREPTEGEPALDQTEVRFAYDDEALWIGARMYSRTPRDIRALVTRRDREGSSEQLIVSLDTHRDRRTAYSFAVTPAGVRIDYFHAADFESDRNYDFDPVWEAKSHIDSIGWTAELRIPFTQLRFNPGDVQEWGVNLRRVVPQTNESSYLILVRRNETGWASRMAVLTGIRGIKPSRRLELLPYIAADSRFRGVVDPDDPFSESRASGVRAGGDVKMGLGPNMTLELTINPGFGQVEADPAVVNAIRRVGPSDILGRIRRTRRQRARAQGKLLAPHRRIVMSGRRWLPRGAKISRNCD